MLNLANLAEEVHIAYRRRIKLKKGDFAHENVATTEYAKDITHDKQELDEALQREARAKVVVKTSKSNSTLNLQVCCLEICVSDEKKTIYALLTSKFKTKRVEADVDA